MIANIALISISILLMIIIARNKNNTYVWIFAGIFLSINIVFVAMIFYNIKLSNYYPAFEIENHVFMMLTRLNVNFFHIRSFVNVGVVLFMMSKFCFVGISRLRSNVKRYSVFLISILALCILYFYFNSFEFVQKLHILKNTVSANELRYVNMLMSVAKIYNYSLLAASIVTPYIALILNYKKTSLKFKKKQYVVLMVFLLILDIFFTVIFVFGSFRGKVINNIDLANLTSYDTEPMNKGFVLISLISLSVINVVYVFMAKYRFFDSVGLFKNRVMLKKIKLLPTDVRNVNHSYKNSIFAIKIICEDIKDNYRDDEKLGDMIGQIDQIASEVLGQIDTFANLTNSEIKKVSKTNIKECIDESVSKLHFKNIEIERNYSAEPKYVLGARSQLCEAIYNILVNSAEAIKTTEKKDGKIKISVYSDIDWVCVSIWDNGCGIRRKDMKKLYNPLFSTKKTRTNWGIGLSYSSIKIITRLL